MISKNQSDGTTVTRLVIAGGALARWTQIRRSLVKHNEVALYRASSRLRNALAECKVLAPCVLLVDLDSLLNFDNPTELMQVLEFGSRIAVLVMVEDESESVLEYLLRLGCMGLLRSDSPPKLIRHAVNTVASHEIWAPADVLARVVPAILNVDKSPRLTMREAEILRLVGRGLSNREISEALNLSRETVRWNMRMIYGKLGVHDRESAVLSADPRSGRRRPVLPETVGRTKNSRITRKSS